MSVVIDELSLSTRTRKGLALAGIKTIDELHQFACSAGLTSAPMLGQKSLNELRETMRELGYDTRNWLSRVDVAREKQRAARGSPRVGRSVWLTVDELRALNSGAVPDSAAEKFADTLEKLDS